MQQFAGAAGPGEGQGEQAHQFGQALGIGEVGVFQIESPALEAAEQGFDIPLKMPL